MLMVIFVSVIPFLFPAYAVSQKAIEWRMQSIYPANDLSTSLQAQTIVDTLNKKLAGKLHIKLFMPGQIVPEEQMWDALSKGVYDAALHGPPWHMGVTPEAIVVFGLPMGWQNVDQIFEFYYKFGMLKWMRDVYAEKNVFFACPLPASPLPIMSNFAFRKAIDIKGKKIWSVASSAAYVINLGGSATHFPPAEIYMALKLGTLDGIVYSMAELDSANYKEVVKYVNFPAVIDPLCVEWIINLKSWKALSADVQKTIDDTLVEIGPSIATKYLKADMQGLEAAKKVGVQEVHMEPGEIPKARQAGVKVWDEMAKKSPRTAKAIQMLKDYLATKGIKVQ
jgi:TRAP-type C4-dicarboxylate transport system substrate-binding protein